MLSLLLILLTADDSSALIKGEELYEAKKYSQAIESLESFVNTRFRGEDVAKAVFLLGESYRALKDWTSAISQYRTIVNNYPGSKWYSASQYFIGKSYWEQSLKSEQDQSATHLAISTLQTFLMDETYDEFADSARVLLQTCKDRLAKKEFENARLYYKLGEYNSAYIYIDYVLSAFPESSYAFDARLLQADIAVKKNNISEAETLLNDLLNSAKPEQLKHVKDRIAKLIQ